MKFRTYYIYLNKTMVLCNIGHLLHKAADELDVLLQTETCN